MITPRKKCHLQVSIQHSPLLDKAQTNKVHYAGAAQSDLVLLQHQASTPLAVLLPFSVHRNLRTLRQPSWQRFTCNLFHVTVVQCEIQWLETLFRTACSFSHTRQGHSWPRLELVYSFSCSLPQVAVLKLPQSVSQENCHITYVTSHIYTTQKARLCSDVSNGSYLCITQHVPFMKTHISLSAEGNDKLQSMQAEELTGCDSGQPIPRAQNLPSLPLIYMLAYINRITCRFVQVINISENISRYPYLQVVLPSLCR